MKLLIAGGRDFTDKARMTSEVINLVSEGVLPRKPTLVCGMARGADITAYHLFKKRNCEVLEYPADWDKHGKSAGHIRNAEMGEVCDYAIVFWDGKSRGTKGMISVLDRLGKPYKLVRY